MSFTRPLTATAILLALAAPAAALTAQATTDLNLRSGPGVNYPVQGVINTSAAVDVQGCIAGSEWCRVSVGGQEGWAYSAYLTTTYQNAPVVIYENTAQLGVEPLTYVPAASGEPLAVTVSGDLNLGRVVDVTAVPPPVPVEPVTLNFVKANPVQPVYLNGEVVVGAAIPDEVDFYPVPESSYRYLNVNNQLVLVDPQQRRIVQVVR